MTQNTSNTSRRRDSGRPRRDRDVAETTTGETYLRGGRTLGRRLRQTSCPACRHPWEEHPGAPDIDAGECCECRYEVEHGELPADAALCRAPVPEELFRRAAPEPEKTRTWQDRLVAAAASVVEKVLDALG